VGFIINSLEISQQNKPIMRMTTDDVVSTIFFSLSITGLGLLIHILNRLRERHALHAQVEDVASQERKEERKRKKKESISNGLILVEWVPDDPLVESTEADQDTPPSGENKMAEAPQSKSAPQTTSSPASCAIGSDDCESLSGEEEEMAGCAICLSHFKPQQVVCESNNSSCQHVFHKDCMVDWLMKGHDTCPMCREVYFLKTV
jgi:hypothetical protein